VTFFPVQARNGLSHSWQFDVQRELPGHWLLDTAYVGNDGFDLLFSTGILGAIPSGSSLWQTGHRRNCPQYARLSR